MGNQVTRVGNAPHKAESSAAAGGNAQAANSIARNASNKNESDHTNSHMQFFPIESLAKVGSIDAVKVDYSPCITQCQITTIR